MQDNKIYAAFGVGTIINIVDNFIPGAEPILRFALFGFQIIIAAFTATLLWRKLRDKKK